MSHMSHIVNMYCIFIILKLVYFTTVFSQLNDLVNMSCGKQMK